MNRHPHHRHSISLAFTHIPLARATKACPNGVLHETSHEARSLRGVRSNGPFDLLSARDEDPYPARCRISKFPAQWWINIPPPGLPPVPRVGSLSRRQVDQGDAGAKDLASSTLVTLVLVPCLYLLVECRRAVVMTAPAMVESTYRL